MMLVSAYPVSISMRASAFRDNPTSADVAETAYNLGTLSPRHSTSYTANLRQRLTNLLTASARNEHAATVLQRVRAQATEDVCIVGLATFAILVIEAAQFDADPASFSAFNVLFECISGYACVGVSVGAAREAYSFCGSWHALSKLVLMAVMIKGRHRCLPGGVDYDMQMPVFKALKLEREGDDERGGWVGLSTGP